MLTVTVPSAFGGDIERAHAAYRAMERIYFDSRSGDYREAAGDRAGAHAWPFSQALAATIGMARLDGPGSPLDQDVTSRFRFLKHRFAARSLYLAWPHGYVYYDDNEWIALDLLDWNAVEPHRSAVRSAVKVFDAVVSAWSTDAALTCPGGIPWTTAPGNHDRNTVTTANGAVLGLRLYLLSHRPYLLQWATRMLAWLDQCMLAPDGLFWDHLGAGTVDATEWSYNQGSIMEAYRLLYLATGNPGDLARAESIADTTLATFSTRWTSSEPPEFAAIFFRRLLQLALTAGRADYVAAARSYAAELSTMPRTRLLAQAALVQIYAALAAPPPAQARTEKQ
ncbi:MAG TPA: glycoside hydrolase family 76 protein [Gaiellaceae bacterium]|nr:glycoside hydrolase family 76 protein [Gaiellaceae bacterium]